MLVHLDTDFGGDTDDLRALAWLLAAPDVDLIGMTTCIDPVGRRAGYVHATLALADRDTIPVAAGAAGSLAGYDGPWGFPPEDEFWPEPVVPRPSPAGDALSLLERSVLAGATIIAIGPYTNLAMLEALRPGLLTSTRVVVMGGTLRQPRPGLPPWGPDKDWNIQADIVSARLVAERCSPVIVPVDVTLETWLCQRDLAALRAASPLGALMARQAEAHARHESSGRMGREHAALPDDFLCFQYDPLACAIAVGWDGAQIETVPLRWEQRERSLVPVMDHGGVATRVVARVDGERFNRYWLDTVTTHQ